jgi:transposase
MKKRLEKRDNIFASLSKKEVAALEREAKSGKKHERVAIRARILLLSHKGKKYREIVHATGCSQTTVINVRRRYRERGSVEATLRDAPRPGPRRKIRPEHENFVVTTARTRAPEGHDHWTLRALRRKLLEAYPKLKAVSHERIRHILLHPGFKPWLEKNAVSSSPRAGMSKLTHGSGARRPKR